MRTTTKMFAIAFFFQIVYLKSFAEVLNVKKFGAKGDGKTDDTESIQAAIDACVLNKLNTIYFPKGVYQLSSYKRVTNYLENYFLLLHSNLIFKGEGNSSVIRLGSHLFDRRDTSANGHLFFGIEIKNVHFTRLLIDMNGSNNLAPKSIIKNQCAIFIISGKNVSIDNVLIKNNAGRNMVIIMGSGSRALVKNSTFLNGGHYVGFLVHNKNQVDFSFVYCEWDSATIVNNHIEQQNIDIALTSLSGGIELHGSYSYAAGNTIIGCNPGLYISSSWYPLNNTVVEKNTFVDCIRGISFWVNYPMNNISIKNNNIQLTHFRAWKNYTINGIEMPNGNTWAYDFNHANASTVSQLLITGNIISGPANPNTTDRSAGIILHSLQNSTISNNIIKGMNFGGVILQGSKWGSTSVKIANNHFSDFKTNYDEISPAAYIVVFDGYTSTDKTAPGLKNIDISGNDFIRKTNSIVDNGSRNLKKRGQFFGSFIALPGNMHQEINFGKNNFSDKKENVYFLKTN